MGGKIEEIIVFLVYEESCVCEIIFNFIFDFSKVLNILCL